MKNGKFGKPPQTMYSGNGNKFDVDEKSSSNHRKKKTEKLFPTASPT